VSITLYGATPHGGRSFTMAQANIPASSLSPRKLAKLVDELGNLNAELRILSDRAEAIKGQLKLSGYEEIVGALFRAKIVSSESNQLDNAKVKALLSPDQIMACSKVVKRCAVSLYDL
jgi:hypothetical protein